MGKNIIPINGRIMINVDVSVKNIHVSKKDYIWNLTTCSCEEWKYFASILDDLAITRVEIIESYEEETKTISTNFNEKKATCKTKKIIYFTYIFINYYSIIESC